MGIQGRRKERVSLTTHDVGRPGQAVRESSPYMGTFVRRKRGVSEITLYLSRATHRVPENVPYMHISKWVKKASETTPHMGLANGVSTSMTYIGEWG